jgi:hypothetical protein
LQVAQEDAEYMSKMAISAGRVVQQSESAVDIRAAAFAKHVKAGLRQASAASGQEQRHYEGLPMRRLPI